MNALYSSASLLSILEMAITGRTGGRRPSLFRAEGKRRTRKTFSQIPGEVSSCRTEDRKSARHLDNRISSHQTRSPRAGADPRAAAAGAPRPRKGERHRPRRPAGPQPAEGGTGAGHNDTSVIRGPARKKAGRRGSYGPAGGQASGGARGARGSGTNGAPESRKET